jgi:hypothetical protein
LPAVPTLLPPPATTSSVPVFPVLLSVPSSKRFALLRFAFAWRKSSSGPVVYLSFCFVLFSFCQRSIALRLVSKL